MTEWTPPREEGLSGDAYLSEQIEAFVDDLSDAHRPGVYALKCSQPKAFVAAVNRFQDNFDANAPDWLSMAWASAGVIYVGGAADVYDRITQHLEEPSKSAALTKVYPIHSVYDVWFCDTVEEAFERESKIAIELQNELGGAYVHQR